MVTLTRLLMIRIVARRRSGERRSLNTRSPDELSSSSSHCTGVSEKKEISLPETKAETRSATMAQRSATMPSVEIGATLSNGLLIMSRRMFATCSVAGKGSVSKTIEISYTKSRGINHRDGMSQHRHYRCKDTQKI